MEHNEAVPTLAERIAQAVAQIREDHTTDQGGLAAVLTALGLPTSTSTITRIETGRQQPTLEELLMLALLSPAGLWSMLAPPFRVGDITIEDLADWDELLGSAKHPTPSHADARLTAYLRSEETLASRRDRLIAADIGCDATTVRDAALRLYGQTANQEIRQRLTARADTDAVEPDPAVRQAYRSHAVRNVTKAIRQHLKEQS